MNNNEQIFETFHSYYKALEERSVNPFTDISDKNLVLDNILYSNLEYFPPKIYINFFVSNKQTIKELFNITLRTSKLEFLLKLSKVTIAKQRNTLLQNLLGEIKERENFLHFFEFISIFIYTFFMHQTFSKIIMFKSNYSMYFLF